MYRHVAFLAVQRTGSDSRNEMPVLRTEELDTIKKGLGDKCSVKGPGELFSFEVDSGFRGCATASSSSWRLLEEHQMLWSSGPRCQQREK